MKGNILKYNQLFYIKYIIDLEKKCVAIYLHFHVCFSSSIFVLFSVCFSKIFKKWNSYWNVFRGFIISSL